MTGNTKHRRSIILFALLSLLLLLLFLPLDWGTYLPGEVSFRDREQLTAHEPGFLTFYPSDRMTFFRAGETIYSSSNPLLEFARLRMDQMIRQDRLLYEQQRIERSTIGDSLLTRQKLRGDLAAMEELSRKIAACSGIAKKDSLFIPRLTGVSENFRFSSGMLLGTLYSGEKVIRVYADDRMIRDIFPGQGAEIELRDVLFGSKGKVISIDLIPGMIRNSVVLQAFGGTIPSKLDENVLFSAVSLESFYMVTILPEGEFDYQPGRYVRVRLKLRKMLAVRIWQILMFALKGELLG